MLTQGISMWLTARAGGGGQEDRQGEGSALLPRKWREIVGRNGSGRRFEPFANQIAIIDGNNHTVETSLSPLPPSPLLSFLPLFAPFRSIAGSNVNNILLCQYYPPPFSPTPPLIHLSIYVPPTSNPIFQFSSASLELQYHATTFQFCSKFEGWGSMTLLSLNRTRGELRIILFHVSFNFCDLCGVSNGWEESGEERRMEGI